jgi:predicted dehydrogenase
MPIRTAIIGYGRNGSTMHAGPVERSDSFEMTAVCDIDAARRQHASERFGCPVYQDYHQMLRTEELYLVCVVTRNDQHAAMACDCLKAGVNVLVTKPWAANVSEAEQMIAVARDTGSKLLPWLPARWGCELRRLKQLVDEGAIGDVFLVRRSVSSFGTRCDWQTESRHAGGYLLNWGAHIVDPPMVLVGGKARSVFAQMRQTINPGDVEDLFLAIVTLDTGTIVQSEYTVSAEQLPGWVVQGTGGTIVVQGKNLKLHKSTPSNPADPTQYTRMEAQADVVTEEILEGFQYGDEHEIYVEIAAALRGEGDIPVSLEDALEVSRVLEAIRVSDRENRVVALP